MVCLYRKGVAQFRMLKSLAAKETLTKAIGIYRNNNDEAYLKRNAKYYLKSIFYLGKCYYDLEQHNNALACFKKVAVDDTRNYMEPVFKQYNVARSMLALGMHEPALQELENLIRKFPGKEYLHDLKGRVFRAKGEHKIALSCFDQALRCRPASYIFIHRAALLVACGELETAAADYHQALKRDRMGKHKILLALGHIALRQHKNNEAKNYFLRAIEFKRQIYDADYAEAHLALSEYYRLVNEQEMARAESDMAAQLMEKRYQAEAK